MQAKQSSEAHGTTQPSTERAVTPDPIAPETAPVDSNRPNKRRWSFGRRLTIRAAIGIAGLVTLGLVFVAWFMDDSLRRELNSLVEEELAEMRIGCLRAPIDGEEFHVIVDLLDGEHPGFTLSGCAWRDSDPKPWSKGGAPPAWPFSTSPPKAPLQTPLEVKHSAPDVDATATKNVEVLGRLARRGRASINVMFADPGVPDPVPGTLHLELVIDGTKRALDLRRVGAGFAFFAVLGGLIAVLLSALVARRLSRLLREVARSVEEVHLTGDGKITSPKNAPEEVDRLATNFRESVLQMRAEHARNVLLTAGLAHELRSPLQNLISRAEISLLKERSWKESSETIGMQLADMRSLALVVDNLITLTALRDAATLPRRELFDLGSEVDLRLTRETEEAGRKQIGIVRANHGNLEIEGDREALVLMLRNLVSNAIHWGSRGSRVTVTLDGRESDLILVVEDEGSGVPLHERQSIFEAFYQGSAPKGERSGYGLGLALARSAARAHGGDIDVTDAKTGGARFTVRLPRARDAGAPGTSRTVRSGVFRDDYGAA